MSNRRQVASSLPVANAQPFGKKLVGREMAQLGDDERRARDAEHSPDCIYITFMTRKCLLAHSVANIPIARGEERLENENGGIKRGNRKRIGQVPEFS